MDNVLSGQSSLRSRQLTLLAAICVATLLLFAYSLVPATQPSTHVFMIDAAYAECLSHSFFAGDWGCSNFGYPSGAIKPFGLPASLGAMALFGWDGRISLSEMRATYALFVLVAFGFSCVFFRRVSGTWMTGILGAALYLLSPIVLEQSGYGSLQLGFALIPGYFVVDSLLLTASKSGSVRWVSAAFTLAVLSRTFSLYLDGYSFILSSVLTLSYFFISALPRNARLRTICAVVGYLAASAIAILAFRQYVDENALTAMPIAFFRGAGVDVATMIAPISSNWPYSVFNLGLDVTPDMLYGTHDDVSSIIGTFIGYTYIAAFLALLWLLFRGKLKWAGGMHSAIAITALIAIALSLGPSLKFMDFRESVGGLPPGAFEHYLMKPEEATLALPTSWIYEHVPGIRNVRVLARWLVLARIAWIACLLILIAHLLRSGHRNWAIALAILALLETSPNPLDNYRTGVDNQRYANGLYDSYPEQLSEAVKPGERVLLFQLHDGANDNHLASDFICARSKVRCYNTGGDKTSAMAQAAWPREVLEVKWKHNVLGNLRDALSSGVVDALVVPHFDLRGIMVSKEAGSVRTNEVRDRAEALAGQLDAEISETGPFSVLRARHDPRGAAGCVKYCWRSWPLKSGIPPIEWGPQVAVGGELFNGQPDGYSAIWVKIKDPQQRYTLAFDDELVATNSNESIVVGIVSARVSKSLKSGTQHPVFLVDHIDRTRHRLGAITVR